MGQQAGATVFELVEGSTEPDLTRVRAVADLDLLSVRDARDQLLALCADGPVGRCLVVEVDADRFVDVRGLGVLVELSQRQRARGGSLVLVTRSRGLTRLLELLQIDGQLPCARTVEDARRTTEGRGR